MSSWNRSGKAQSARKAAVGAWRRAAWAVPASIDRRRRPRRDKTALVLGGGGFTGGVYEIGALRALDLLAVNSTVNNFDVYVGTSAGSFIAALCANGVTPEEMMRVVTRQGKPAFKDIDIGDLLRAEPARVRAQGRADAVARGRRWRASCSRQPGGVSMMDVLLGLADDLPSGLYTGAGIERYLHQVLSEPGPHRRLRRAAMRALPDRHRPRHLRARGVRRRRLRGRADLDRRARLGGAADGLRARSINDRELIDGGIVSTTNLDIAVEAGAKLVVVINPIVPFINDFEDTVSTLRGSARAQGLGHGLRADRLPGVQARRPPAPARTREDAGRTATRASTSC